MTFASLYGRMSDEVNNPRIKVVPIVASSYKDSQSASTLKLYADWIVDGEGCDIRNRTVLVLDDVLETGSTATSVLSLLRTFEPSDLRSAFIVGKDLPQRDFKGDYVLFPVPALNPETKEPLFFVGCGMDWAGEYRFIEDIIDVNSRPDLKAKMNVRKER